MSDSESLRLENATKDLLPWEGVNHGLWLDKTWSTLNFRLTMEGMNSEKARNWTAGAIEGLRDGVTTKDEV